jgi:hypothetical protein
MAVDAEESGRLAAGLRDGFSGAAQLDTRTAQLREEVVAAAKAACRSRLSVMGEEKSRVQLMERVHVKRRKWPLLRQGSG